MTTIDALLARAHLHHRPDVPVDTIAYDDFPHLDLTADPAPGEAAGETVAYDSAAHQLNHLCELVVAAVAPGTLEFLTDQVPEPPGAWLLGCALHLAGVDDGARFWWQYSAGAGHAPAAYCLSLHHHARGEAHAAAFWYDQTGLDATADGETFPRPRRPANTCRYDASIPTVLRVLSRLTAPGQRRLPHRADAITNYVADAVTHGYQRHPGIEIPVPESRFSDRVHFLLTAVPPGAGRVPRVLRPDLPSRRQINRPNIPQAHHGAAAEEAQHEGDRLAQTGSHTVAVAGVNRL